MLKCHRCPPEGHSLGVGLIDHGTRDNERTQNRSV